ncbi:glycosyltransferase family 39 protein [Psychromarinibacter sp. C21-152]|uniref:Glycosyltransferase family 39 protein n=1 Tax=Psychromarinibacter sediminicola TaxID=3033385 RepID=A0AAE3NNM9_9RHOB|nr:glycosyltransferase family 39 protein [Psychromarinibacter sediminicola]MDF0600658.1 glycosyltransferase family 39 protein [Psychromarinibacter sediminicola]
MTRGWLVPATAAVVAVTLCRVALLWLDGADATAAEARAWAGAPWLGQLGAPPLTGWVIWLFAQFGDGPVWLRLPGPLLHAAAALILGGIADRLFGARVAALVAVGWITLPAVAIAALGTGPGTVMAPLLAAALALYMKLLDEYRAWVAAATGLFLGLACLASYWAILFLASAVLAGRVFSEARPSRSQAVLLMAVWGAVMTPHLVVGAVEGGLSWAVSGPWGGWGAFLAVVLGAGPLAVPLVLAAERPGNPVVQFLLIFFGPVAALTALSAPLGIGGGGWAAAWLAGLPVALAWLRGKRRWRRICLAVNALVCLAVPLAPVVAERGLLQTLPWVETRAGRGEMSATVLDIAADLKIRAVVAADPELRADLSYFGRGRGVAVHAPGASGVPEARDVLLILRLGVVPPCPTEVMEVAEIAPDHGAYRRWPQVLHLVPGSCLR